MVDDRNGLNDAERYLKQGYGLIVLMNHFSMCDGVEVLHLLNSRTTIRRRPFLAPIARHQLGPLLDLFADSLDIQLNPVVTDNSMKSLGDKVTRIEGLADYLAAAITCLRKGGIVLVATQGARKAQLGEPVGRPVGSLLAHACRNGVDNVALMFIGISICAATEYDLGRVGGFNIDKVYELRLGKTLPADVVIEQAGGRRSVDAWVFDCLRQLVPSAYGGTNSKSGQLIYTSRGVQEGIQLLDIG